NTYKCGGTHVGNGWVLTALHCVDGAYDIGVMANTTNVNQPTSIADCLPDENPDCLSVRPVWGLALVGFGQAVSDQVKSIALPGMNSTLQGSVHVVGWGETFSDIQVGDLRGVTLNIVSASNCSNHYVGVPTPGYCAEGHLDGLCSGDSGGGLYDGA